MTIISNLPAKSDPVAVSQNRNERNSDMMRLGASTLFMAASMVTSPILPVSAAFAACSIVTALPVVMKQLSNEPAPSSQPVPPQNVTQPALQNERQT